MPTGVLQLRSVPFSVRFVVFWEGLLGITSKKEDRRRQYSMRVVKCTYLSRSALAGRQNVLPFIFSPGCVICLELSTIDTSSSFFFSRADDGSSSTNQLSKTSLAKRVVACGCHKSLSLVCFSDGGYGLGTLL